MIKKLYSKYREPIRYLFFGALTTVVSLGVYFLCTRTFLDPGKPAQLQLANVLSWIAAASFAYVTNRKYVFEDRSRNVAGQASAFFLSRLGTLGMDMGLMFLGCTVLGLDDRWVKLAVQAAVVSANYLLSKLVVFRKDRDVRPADGRGGAGALLLYTVLFAVTAALVYAPFLRAGRGFVWTGSAGDGLYQHFNAFVYLGQYIRTVLDTLLREHRLVLPMWDFSIGMGGDVITTLSYYGLGDPFCLLSAFFPPERAELGYTLAILLRLYCAGLSFRLYSRKLGAGSTGALCGALAYVFCSFALFAANRHPGFVLPMIWLPLVWGGAEKLLRGESPAPYVLSVFAAAVSNFYFFYMIAVLTALYVLIRGFSAVQGRPAAYARLVGRIAGLSVIGLAMAAVLFLPSALAYLGSSRHAGEYAVEALYAGREYAAYPGSLVSVNAATLWAYLGVSPIALAGVFLELVRRGRERWPRVLLGLFVLFLLFPVFGYALNGFGYVTNRWVFAWALLVCLLLSRNLDAALSGRQKLALGLCVLVYTALIALLPRSREENALVGAAVLWLSALLLILIPAGEARPGLARIRRCGAVALTILGILVNGYYLNSENKGNYPDEFSEAGAALSHLEGGDGAAFGFIRDDGFYRVDTGRRGNINRNFALHEGVSSTTVYFSILPTYMSDYLCHVQAYDQMLDMYKGLQSRVLLRPFAAAKYYVTAEKYQSQMPPDCRVLQRFQTETGEERLLCVTDDVLPLGYTCDSYVAQEEYLAMTPVQRQQVMLHAAVLPDGAAPEGSALRRGAPSFTDHAIPFTAEDGDGAAIRDGKIVVRQADGAILLHAACPANEELYLRLEGLEFQAIPDKNDAETAALGAMAARKAARRYVTDTTIKANAEKTTFSSASYFTSRNIYASGRDEYLLNLFTAPKERSFVRIRFAKPGVYTFDRLELIAQPLDALAPALDALRAEPLTNVQMDVNTVSGDVSLSREKVLCLSIPYSGGWKLEVDGQRAPLLRVNDMYMGTILPPGDHRIVLTYATPYLEAGLTVSLCGLALLLLVLFLRRRRSPNN